MNIAPRMLLLIVAGPTLLAACTSDSEPVLGDTSSSVESASVVETAVPCGAVQIPDDPAEAVSLGDASIDADPANAEAYFLRGTGLLRRGEFDDAIEAFSGAIALDPECGPYHAGMGISLTAVGGQDAEAVSALDTAVDLGVASAEVDLNRGVLFARAGDLDAAVALFETSVESEPSAIGWLNLGRARLGLGESLNSPSRRSTNRWISMTATVKRMRCGGMPLPPSEINRPHSRPMPLRASEASRSQHQSLMGSLASTRLTHRKRKQRKGPKRSLRSSP